MPTIPAKERCDNNKEVALGFTEEQVADECSRCYRCSGVASVDEESCLDCQMCWEYCDFGAITMEKLPEDKIISYPLPGPEQVEQVIEICRKLHLDPMDINRCSCTNTTPEEVINAILTGGARTIEDLSRLTGIRSACTMYCGNEMVRILEACGYPQEPRKDDSFHPITTTLFTIPDEVAKETDPRMNFEKQKKLQSDPAYYEAVYENYRKVVAERSKNNG